MPKGLWDKKARVALPSEVTSFVCLLERELFAFHESIGSLLSVALRKGGEQNSQLSLITTGGAGAKLNVCTVTACDLINTLAKNSLCPTYK